MRIEYSKQYFEMFRKLTREQQKLVLHAIDLFKENPFHETLENHALTREHQWEHAISADSDLRLVFKKKWDYVEVSFIRVWKHGDVYKFWNK